MSLPNQIVKLRNGDQARIRASHRNVQGVNSRLFPTPSDVAPASCGASFLAVNLGARCGRGAEALTLFNRLDPLCSRQGYKVILLVLQGEQWHLYRKMRVEDHVNLGDEGN